MTWYWHSVYDFKPTIADLDPTHPPSPLGIREILTRSIELLKRTADVHDVTNFPESPAGHVDTVGMKLSSGFLVIAYRPWKNTSRYGFGDDTLYFQYSRRLSEETGDPVWSVSHGLEPLCFNTITAPDDVYCQGYVQARLTQPLRDFMKLMGIDRLYSIDESRPDLSTPGSTENRPIRRLQGWGSNDPWIADAPNIPAPHPAWWVADMPTAHPVTPPTVLCHEHWGHPVTKELWLTTIRYAGPDPVPQYPEE